MGWPDVRGYSDGENVSQEVLNRPINNLAERTEHLLRLANDSDRSKLTVAGVRVSSGAEAVNRAGLAVYRRPNGAFAAAAADAGNGEWFYAADSAMAVGIAYSVSGSNVTVALSGYVDFGAGIDVSELIVDEDPSSGRYFLSTTPGKLTAAPIGPIIYVCDCLIDGAGADAKVKSMIVSPQYRDTGESHVHRTFVIPGAMQGGCIIKAGSTRYVAGGIACNEVPHTATAYSTNVRLLVLGAWDGSLPVTYSVTLRLNSGASAASTNASDYSIEWTSGGADGSGSVALPKAAGGGVQVGSHGLKLGAWRRSDGTDLPGSAGCTFTVQMPAAGQGWTNHQDGFKYNLAMHPEMARFVPPLPVNGAALVVDGVELRGAEFGSPQWSLLPADSQGGPWIYWHEAPVVGNSATAPMVWDSNLALQRPRAIALHSNRARVGPTGFVTSLQAAPGSLIKVTSAQTNAEAMQGALQVGLAVDFSTSDNNVQGAQVVKRVVGSTFETGPVVERIIAGPGVSVDNSQGTVTVSAGNSAYSGDFETIALKNAKQDLAGGVFPYTKLLGWSASGGNVNSGFTAKFRVPDYIPYGSYNVVVSASVFGEQASPTAKFGAFTLTPYVLPDHTLGSVASQATPLNGSIASPQAGAASTVAVEFNAYAAFDPVLVHGMADIGTASSRQLQYSAPLLLKQASGGSPIIVKPGYFVGVAVARSSPGGGATPYTAPLGFMSLRWSLIPV